MRRMAEDHRSLRLPHWIWDLYADVVGDIGRAADLRHYMDWRIDNPGVGLGDDVQPPHEFLTTLRVETIRWELFAEAVGESNASADLRRYIWWRLQHPAAPLPGRRLPPLRRSTRRPACV